MLEAWPKYKFETIFLKYPSDNYGPTQNLFFQFFKFIDTSNSNVVDRPGRLPAFSWYHTKKLQSLPVSSKLVRAQKQNFVNGKKQGHHLCI